MCTTRRREVETEPHEGDEVTNRVRELGVVFSKPMSLLIVPPTSHLTPLGCDRTGSEIYQASEYLGY